MFDAIARILGKVLYFIYNTIGFHNYGLSLIMFTVLIKCALLPLTVKQIKSTQQMQELQPELERLQKRYKNDKEKLNEETMKLYQEKGVNPAGGCLPMLVQLPIIFSLFYTIRRPLTYMLGWTKEAIGSVVISIMNLRPEFFQGKQFTFIDKFEDIKTDPLAVAELFERNPYYEINVIDAMNKIPNVAQEGMEKISLDFLGIINLGVKPSYDFNVIAQNPSVYIMALVMVVIAVGTTFLSTWLSMRSTSQSSNAQANQTGKSMMYVGPLMTLLISFQTPLGLSLYWTVSNVFQIAQQLFIEKYVRNKKE
ncbi:MAG: membrane protein insertase YidC [Clostridiaceae bacterium]|jgi:YidC/Oxa1 family membrane protein insertase|nr:membrane protein insertase YidC [Clostridiaceae bacterium]